MQVVNRPSRYGAMSQSIHWITAALVIALLLMGKVGDIETDEPNSALFIWHSSLGVLVFALVIVRITWSLISPPPPLPDSMTRSARRIARAVHVAFYALLVALPLSGWLLASAESAPVSVFGITSVPRWEFPAAALTPEEMSRDEEARQDSRREGPGEPFEEIHEVLGNILLALAILHALVALKHHFINRDDVLRRMLPIAKGPIPR